MLACQVLAAGASSPSKDAATAPHSQEAEVPGGTSHPCSHNLYSDRLRLVYKYPSFPNPQPWLPLCTVIPSQWALSCAPQFLHRVKLQFNSSGSQLSNVPLTVCFLFPSLLLRSQCMRANWCSQHRENEAKTPQP